MLLVAFRQPGIHLFIQTSWMSSFIQICPLMANTVS